MTHEAYMAAIRARMPIILLFTGVGVLLYKILVGAFFVMLALFVFMGFLGILTAYINKKEAGRVAKRLERRLKNNARHK